MNPKCGDGMEPVPTNVRGEKHVAEPAPTKAWRIEDGVKHLPAESFLKRLPQGDDQHDGGPPSACDAFTARALSRLVEGMQSLRDGTQRGVFSSNVMDLVRDRFGGNVSAFARVVEVHRSTASDWATGTRQPSIVSLVGLAQRFGGELLDWINGRLTWSADNSPPPIEQGKRSKTRRPLRRYPPAIVQAHLTRALVAPEDTSPSFAAICRRLGVSQTVAKRLFPDLAGELMGRYSVCRADRKRVRESLVRSAVESAVERLIADGRALSGGRSFLFARHGARYVWKTGVRRRS
jgi:hypothetical protein